MSPNPRSRSEELVTDLRLRWVLDFEVRHVDEQPQHWSYWQPREDMPMQQLKRPDQQRHWVRVDLDEPTHHQLRAIAADLHVPYRDVVARALEVLHVQHVQTAVQP
jgi:hypothetical protein